MCNLVHVFFFSYWAKDRNINAINQIKVIAFQIIVTVHSSMRHTNLRLYDLLEQIFNVSNKSQNWKQNYRHHSSLRTESFTLHTKFQIEINVESRFVAFFPFSWYWCLLFCRQSLYSETVFWKKSKTLSMLNGFLIKYFENGIELNTVHLEFSSSWIWLLNTKQLN